MEGYVTPAGSAESEYSEKKSVFLGHLKPVEREDEAKAFIAEMKKKYADARHNVWAYALPDGTVRSSDDGEPAGTGGAPVLDSIVKRGLTGCVIVVTRYFGGILLGTGGLVRAYGSAAGATLEAAGSVRMTVYLKMRLKCTYAQYGGAVRLIEKYGGKVTKTGYAEEVEAEFILKPEKKEELARALTDFSSGALKAEEDGEIFRRE